MELDESKLLSPKHFEFPFPPYEIQIELMHHIYSTIENRKVGVFESPTGTVSYF